jgi:hypothetical protein
MRHSLLGRLADRERQTLRSRGSNIRFTLADCAGENERIGPAAERGKHLTDPSSQTMDEHINREPRTIIAVLRRR